MKLYSFPPIGSVICMEGFKNDIHHTVLTSVKNNGEQFRTLSYEFRNNQERFSVCNWSNQGCWLLISLPKPKISNLPTEDI